MNEQFSVLHDPRAKAYLAEVHVAVARRDASAADGIMREIADHLREAAAEPDFDLERTLADLGDPALIAAGVEPAATPEAVPSRGFADSVAGVVLAVLALTVGVWWMLLVGWVVGIALLWSSHRWTRTDKVVGTAAWPFAVVAGTAATAFGGVVSWDVLFAAGIAFPLAAGAWLLVRGLRGVRPAAPDRLPVVARAGRGAWLERPLALGVTVGAAVAALGVVVFVALAGGSSPEPLLALLATAGLAAIVSAAVLWASRSWEVLDKTVGTVLLVAATGAVVLAWIGAVNAGTSGTLCTPQACTPVVTLRPEHLLPAVTQIVVPLLLAYAVMLAVRFRAADDPGPWRIHRRGAIVIVAALTVGGAGFVFLVLARPAAGALLVAAVALLTVWGAAIVCLWRSAGWTNTDRGVATLVLPLLSAIPLILPRRYAAQADSAVNPLLPTAGEDPALVLVWSVFGVASVVLAIWLLVRFVPDEPRRGSFVVGDAALTGDIDRQATHPGTSARSRRNARAAGIIGFAVVVAYAVVAALQILVWNPLAAVPGATLAEITAHLAATGESFSVASVLGVLAIGPLLALAPLILSWRTGTGAFAVIAGVLAILAGGAVGYFAASFSPGMSLADAYGISGGDYAPWGRVLMLVSAVALLAAVVCGAVLLRRGRGRMEG
ncbi:MULTISPECIES: hypothetical protein [unclassified Microbacterium]|uniref:hypothetical protein n=1 Tax=unclassified Microbacterium TaxID=2609290 RepID=UPI0025E54767|nr:MULTISPECIES: hypothetical protein [unclassified Microbacterium]